MSTNDEREALRANLITTLERFTSTNEGAADAVMAQLASLPTPAPAVGETEGMADLLSDSLRSWTLI